MTCRTNIAFLVLLTMLIGSGCKHEVIPSEKGCITFTFSTGEVMTRAVSGNPVDGGGIDEISSNNPDIIIALADNSGSIVAWYPNKVGDLYTSDCSSSSTTEATISFESPEKGTYSVYAVANSRWLGTSETNPALSSVIQNATTVSQLEALVLQRTSPLSFDASHPMPLSAKGTVTANARGAGQVNLELKRIVARVGLSFDNKTEDALTLYNCYITLHRMNPLKGYLFIQNTDYVNRGNSDEDDLVLCDGEDIVISGTSYNLTPRLVFPSIAPTQQEGGRMYLCDISFRIVKQNQTYVSENPNTYKSYENQNLPIQNLSTYENILALSRNQDLTISTEINKRGQDQDISFNFTVTGWTDRTENIIFN